MKTDKDIIAKLKEYVRHKSSCDSHCRMKVDGKIIDCECNCGLSDLLK